MKKILIFLFLLIVSLPFLGQKHTFLHFFPKFGSLDFQINTNYVGIDGIDVNIDHFKYYVSDIKVIHDGGQIIAVHPDVFLIEPDSFSIYLGEYPIISIEQIQFMVGVPQRFNTQNGTESADISTYPETHPLSFQSPSMYWGWQAGYMHMIVGGEADGNNDQIPDTYFELHNLGNQNQRTVLKNVLATESSANQLDVYMECHLEYWLKDIPISTVGNLHGETGFNLEVMKNVDTKPVFVQSASAIIPEFGQNEARIWMVGSELHWMNLPNGITRIYDLSGMLILTVPHLTIDGHMELSMSSGCYLFSTSDDYGNVFTRSNRLFLSNME